MQGLILAAGMGSRLKKLTQNNTKGMVEVNGVSLMKRMLTQLDKQNLKRIIVVTGYEGAKLEEAILTFQLKTPVVFVRNDIYNKTNNIYSLFLAKSLLCEDDTLLLESDLIFDDVLLTQLIEDERPNLALVAKFEAWMDGTCVKINDKDEIIDFIPGKQFDYAQADEYYKTINIYKFSKAFSKDCYFPFLEAYMSTLGVNEYYEAVLKIIVGINKDLLQAKVLEAGKWYEIDDEQDLDIASSIFAEKPVKLEKFQKRFGGYWRYPNLLDYCYLVNPYFPPKQMVEELKYNFKILLEQYPSGQGVNCLLAAKNFNINKDYMVVGNGAAELIKSLMEQIEGNVGFIRPTFEEYPNRYPKQNSIVYVPKNDDFAYNSEDIMQYFTDKNLSALVLINPDNPSGNYIQKQEVLNLITWAKEHDILFVLDESFVDFAVEEDNTFIKDELLELYNKFVVVKSISKSYGVPGCRLGVLTTSDKDLINYIRKDVSIWNLNSFGEYYLQIYGKYHKFYAEALVKIKAERARFVEELKKFPQLRVIPSQANYMMIELLEHDSKIFSEVLLADYEIFIKDLTPKIDLNNRQFIRIAVRDTQDNNRFIDALTTYFN